MIAQIPLIDVCDVTMGQAPVGSSYNENGDGYALIAGAGDFGEITPKPKKFTTIPTRISKPNDLILCIRATIGDLNWSDREYCLGRGVAGLRPKPNRLDTNYLWHFIHAHKESLKSKGTGSTFKQVNRSHIQEWQIPLPPLAEQKRIAAILDKADAIRRKRQQAIDLTDQLLRSVFLDMFGDPVTNPMGWEIILLEKITDIYSGITKGRKIKEQTLTEIPYMRVANVQDGHIKLDDISKIAVSDGEKERYKLIKNDILLTEGGDPDKLGRGAVWNAEITPCIHQNHIFRVRIKDGAEFTPHYLSTLIGSQYGKRYFLKAAKQTTGIATINKSQLKEFPVLVPPFDIQKKFEKYVEKYSAYKDKYEKLRDVQIQLSESLTQRAFRGELSQQSEAA